MFGKVQQITACCLSVQFRFVFSKQKIPVNFLNLILSSVWYLSRFFLSQSQSDGESHRSIMEKDDPRSSPSPPSTPSICSPISSASSVPSTGKNVCASCGLEILDRYLLKVCVCVCRLVWPETRLYNISVWSGAFAQHYVVGTLSECCFYNYLILFHINYYLY